MRLWEIILIIACAAFVAAVIIASFVSKKKGKTSCDCGCSSCPHCQYCKKSEDERK